MSSIQLFDFTWQYQPDEEGDQPPANALEIGDPDEVTPLDINIQNILPDKEITLNPIAGVTTASTTNYHFKLAFDPGILNTPAGIGVEGDNWSIYHHSDASADSLYLLWKGDEITIPHGQLLPQDKEITLTGVAAKGASDESQFIDLAATTTVITISWQFKQGDIKVITVNVPEFKRHSTYKTSLNLTLDMVQTTGKLNIPLFVGFVGSNQVLNVNDGKSNLKLRLTNTNLPNGKSIPFHYDSDPAKRSQLQIMLEAGGNDWALGTADEVNDIEVSIEGGKWPQKSKEQVKVGNNVKGYIWTFEPNCDRVTLAPQETMLIDLNGIVTSKPTGATNLYFYYSYVPGYKDGKFICQIEKAPLAFDGKRVGIGMSPTIDSEGTLDVVGDYYGKGHIWLHAFSGDNKTGTAYLQARDMSSKLEDPNKHTDIDLQFRTQKAGEIQDVMRLTKDSNVGIGTDSPAEKLEVDGTTKTQDLTVTGTTNTQDLTVTETTSTQGLTVDGKLEVTGDYYGKGHIWLHAFSGDNKSGTAYIQARDNSKSKDKGTDIDLQFRTQKAGEIQDVMRLTKDGKVGISTDSPSENLEVDGTIKATDLTVTGTTNTQGLKIDSGNTVSGIPIVQVKDGRVDNFSTGSDNKQQNVTVNLDSPADVAYAVLKGFDIDYHGTDHEIERIKVDVWADNPSGKDQVKVHILVDACDASGHRLEANYVEFVVIAIGSTTV